MAGQGDADGHKHCQVAYHRTKKKKKTEAVKTAGNTSTSALIVGDGGSGLDGGGDMSEEEEFDFVGTNASVAQVLLRLRETAASRLPLSSPPPPLFYPLAKDNNSNAAAAPTNADPSPLPSVVATASMMMADNPHWAQQGRMCGGLGTTLMYYDTVR